MSELEGEFLSRDLELVYCVCKVASKSKKYNSR